jgi:hypothetical protein
VSERTDILEQAVVTMSLICEGSDAGVGYFNRTAAFPAGVDLLSSPDVPEALFSAIGRHLPSLWYVCSPPAHTA